MPNTLAKVLIVGSGPSGLTLASELLRQGIKCKIIDKRESSSTITRAVNITSATLYVFNLMGISKNIIERGKQAKEITIYWQGNPITNINYKYQKKIPFPYFFYLPQPEVESILNDHFLSLGGKVERGVSLIDFKQNKNNITVNLSYKHAISETEDFDYVIGCDGGKSLVREQIGIDCNKADYGTYFILADSYIDWSGDSNKAHYFVTKNGYLMIVPLPNGMHRLIASYKNPSLNQSPAEPILEDFEKVLAERGPGNIKIKQLIWVTSAPFRHQIATTCQKKHVFLAGDACHLFSPVGGMTMNTGIQDAYNLAWKLAYQIKGFSKSILLNSYAKERIEAVHTIRDMTQDATYAITQQSFINSKKIEQFFPLIKNRKFIKKLLPLQFSGFDVGYKNSPIIRKSKTLLKIEQNHYYNFSHTIKDKKNNPRKHILVIYQESKSKNIPEINELLYFLDRNYKEIIVPINNINTDHVPGTICLIRPDHYIGYLGSIYKIEAFKKYLKKLFNYKEFVYEKTYVGF